MTAASTLAVTGSRSHVVQFYTQDEELAQVAGDYLREAVTSGGTAVVVAAPQHRQALMAALAKAGVDLQLAQSAGALRLLDAQETLDEFLVAGWPDPARFDEVIGGVLRQAAAAGRPVRVYGEMVALLWDAGQVSAALALESRWNDLERRVPFSLFCAYPVRVAAGPGDTDAFAQVCTLHSAVVGVPPLPAGPPALPGDAIEAERAFANVRDAPRAARQFVSETLARWGVMDLVDDAAIVVTELATNAIVHARSGFTVRVTQAPGLLRIRVADEVPLTRPLAAAIGHGLGVVAALASRWQAEPADGGKAVWADLPCGAAS